MALTGLQIQKLLPKTNCKECGCSTCLAFAMKLAAKKAELAECPYVSDEAKAILGAAAEPPIRTVTLGAGEQAFKAGGETVVFRHEKTFVNQTGLGLAVDDGLDDGELEQRVRTLLDYELERVGEVLRLDAISVAFRSGSPERFGAALEKVASIWPRALVARSDDAAVLRAAAEKLRGRRPLLASATPATVAELAAIAKETGSALALAADNFNDLVALVGQLRGAEFRDIFLELRAGLAKQLYAARRVDDPIAVYYSQPSWRVHWILQTKAALARDREIVLKPAPLNVMPLPGFPHVEHVRVHRSQCSL